MVAPRCGPIAPAARWTTMPAPWSAIARSAVEPRRPASAVTTPSTRTTEPIGMARTFTMGIDAAVGAGVGVGVGRRDGGAETPGVRVGEAPGSQTGRDTEALGEADGCGTA